MKRKSLILILSVMLFISKLSFSQISEYPWSESFESALFETNGWTQQIISGSAWEISSNGTQRLDAKEGANYAIISNTSYTRDTVALVSPVFNKPTDIDTLKLTFWYANPIWNTDLDYASVYYYSETDSTELATINTEHSDWTKMEILMKVDTLDDNFQIIFNGMPEYGYGFFLDDISLKSPKIIPDTLETETYLQVGTNDTLTITELPTYDYYNYSYSQQLFWAEEMGGARTIYSISFCQKEVSEDHARICDVYLGHTDKDEFYESTDWISVENLTRVYSGFIFNSIGQDWITIVFDTPFEYNGTDNLVVAFDDNSGNYVLATSYAVSATQGNMSIYVYNDSDNYDPANTEFSGSILTLRSNTRFGLVEIENPVVIDTLETETYLQVGTDNKSSVLPVDISQKYSYSQQLFDSVEMGGPRTIHSISFKIIGMSFEEETRNIAISLGVTDADYFLTDTSWVAQSSLTEVYSGNKEISETPGWVTFVFAEPFEYDGNGSLVVAVHDESGVMADFRNFESSFANMYKSLYMGEEEPINTDSLSLYYSSSVTAVRNNVRFGIVPVSTYTVTVVPNDPLMGKTSESVTCVEGYGTTVSATPFIGFKFDRWSDGSIANPRYIIPTSDTTLIANFSAVETDTLNYDNGVYNVVVGSSVQDSLRWGIMLSPTQLASRPNLTDVLFYVDGEHAFGNYILEIYQGFDTIPANYIYRDNIVVDSAEYGWISFAEMNYDFNVEIDTTLPLWIVLCNADVRYPAATSTYSDEGFRNGAWWNAGGTWTQQAYGAWMIKAVLPQVDDSDNITDYKLTTFEIYPNPANDYINIYGVENGDEVKIFNSLGEIVEIFIYESRQVYVGNYTAGMYFVLTNKGTAKFIKE